LRPPCATGLEPPSEYAGDEGRPWSNRFERGRDGEAGRRRGELERERVGVDPWVRRAERGRAVAAERGRLPLLGEMQAARPTCTFDVNEDTAPYAGPGLQSPTSTLNRWALRELDARGEPKVARGDRGAA
jgi:hypothetical protein